MNSMSKQLTKESGEPPQNKFQGIIFPFKLACKNFDPGTGHPVILKQKKTTNTAELTR